MSLFYCYAKLYCTAVRFYYNYCSPTKQKITRRNLSLQETKEEIVLTGPDDPVTSSNCIACKCVESSVIN